VAGPPRHRAEGVAARVNLFPLVTFDLIDDVVADALLDAWGHWLGSCDRPFGRQSFGLYLHGEIVSVAVSASTAGATAGGWDRYDVCELARQASHPEHRQFTRVMVRLWRECAPACWSSKYWPVLAVVSYHNRNRHLGNIYRFDGWTKVADMPGSGGGGTYSKSKPREPKSVWVYELPRVA